MDCIYKMPMFWTFGELVEENDDWLEYRKRLEHAFTSNEITDSHIKCLIMNNNNNDNESCLVCAEQRNISSWGPWKHSRRQESWHTKIWSTTGLSLQWLSSVLGSEAVFRKSGESISKCVAKLSEYCKFGDVLEDMLHNRLVSFHSPK